MFLSYTLFIKENFHNISLKNIINSGIKVWKCLIYHQITGIMSFTLYISKLQSKTGNCVEDWRLKVEATEDCQVFQATQSFRKKLNNNKFPGDENKKLHLHIHNLT